MTTIGLLSQLDTIIKRLKGMGHKLRAAKIRPTKDQLGSFEAFAAKISETATSLSAQIRDLSRGRTEAPIEECNKLISQAQSSIQAVAEGQINLAIMKRNLIKFFEGPKHSSLDSDRLKARNKATGERCETICSLDPDTIITWAASFPPTVWAASAMSQNVFEYLTEKMKPEKTLDWPKRLHEILRDLGAEEPLRGCNKYHNFVKAIEDRAALPSNRNCDEDRTAEAQPLTYCDGVPWREPVMLAYASGQPENDADEATGLVFDVPAEELGELEKLHHQSATREHHSIILGVPFERRVASVCFTLPRDAAFQYARQKGFPITDRPNPIFA